MARGNYPVCKSITLVHEGGTSNHKDDPGGFTSRGVTAAAGAGYRKRMGLPPKAVNKWTAAEVDAFYHDDYWLGVSAELLPWGVDLATFDAGVNSGVSRGAKWLQRGIGVRRDGNVGPLTLAAVSSVPGDVLVKRICGYRLSFVQGLGTFKVFGRGWSRRIADIEAKGVAMWLRNNGTSAGKTADRMAREAEAASGKAMGQAKGGSVAGAGGAATGVGDYVAGGTGWLLVVLGVAVVVGALLLVKSRQNAARAAAYGAAMDEHMLDEMAGQ